MYNGRRPAYRPPVQGLPGTFRPLCRDTGCFSSWFQPWRQGKGKRLRRNADVPAALLIFLDSVFSKKRTAWNFLETMPNLRLPPSYPTHSTIREVHAVKGGMNVLRHQDLLLLCDALKIGGIQDKGGGSDRKQLFSRMFFCRTDFQTGRANLQVGVYKCPPTAHPLAFCVLEIAWIMQVQRHCQENGRPKKRGVILPYSQQRMVEWWNFGMTHSATTPHCRKNERIMVTNKKSVEFWHVATLHYLRPCKPIPAEQATQSPRRYDYPPLSSKHTLSLLPKTMFWKQTFWV